MMGIIQTIPINQKWGAPAAWALVGICMFIENMPDKNDQDQVDSYIERSQPTNHNLNNSAAYSHRS